MPHHADAETTARWLAFESGVLHRLSFRSISITGCGANDGRSAPALALQLKRRGACVHLNCATPAALVSGVAHVVNNTERLTAEDLDRLTLDLYVPCHRLPFPELRARFDEPTAWWLSNLRERIAELESPARRALALDLALRTLRYAESFGDTTAHLRLSLTEALRRIWTRTEPPVDNRRANTCRLIPAHEFLAEQQTDLALIRLPRFPATTHYTTPPAAYDAWQPAWLGDEFRTGDDRPARTLPPFPTHASRTQYLHAVEELLARAAHIEHWALVLTGDGNIAAEDFLAAVRRVRPVKTIYTKDFSEWTGTRVSIITA